ncbi:MAG TPA: hypothetical protein VFW75_02110 [Acetobacteraceae bacterium]|nr:hypothetical protein [Acetobacteraceae bacterium]
MPSTYAATFSGTSFAGVAVSAAQDLFSMLASSTVPFMLNRLSISTAGVTNPGNLVISVQRFTPTVTQGSGGSAIAAASLSEIAQYTQRNATTTVRANDTTRASTSGSKELIWTGTVQDLNNLDDNIVPELWPFIPGNCALILGLEVAPAAAVTLYGTAQFTELT